MYIGVGSILLLGKHQFRLWTSGGYDRERGTLESVGAGASSSSAVDGDATEDPTILTARDCISGDDRRVVNQEGSREGLGLMSPLLRPSPQCILSCIAPKGSPLIGQCFPVLCACDSDADVVSGAQQQVTTIGRHVSNSIVIEGPANRDDDDSDGNVIYDSTVGLQHSEPRSHARRHICIDAAISQRHAFIGFDAVAGFDWHLFVWWLLYDDCKMFR